MWNRQIKKWSAVELWYLIENYHGLSTEDLCKDMLKNEEQIQEQVHKLSLDKDPHGSWKPRGIFICSLSSCKQAFTATEYEFKRDNARFCSVECSAASRTLSRPSKKALVRDYQSGMSTNDISVKHQVSKGTIYNWFKFYDIKTRTVSDSLKEFFKSAKGYSAITSRLNTLEKKYGTRLPPTKTKGRYHRGFRPDLGISVRSGWEANVLRYLKHNGTEFEYEPQVFIFHGIKKGNLSYLPDVYLPKENIWLEVKGQLRPADRVKIRRFKKFYPEEFSRLRVIVKSSTVKAAKFYEQMGIPVLAYYKDLDKEYREVIEHWE